MIIKNAHTLPEVYYGLHMAEGVAEYQEPGKDPYRIFIGEECLKRMDNTFEGRPIYVEHVDEVDLANIQQEADGYVFNSFFNQADGKHWAKIIIVSDRGKRAIANGWKLSNAYVPKKLTNGGLWHGVEYSKEVSEGEYEHLAIVRNPRYEESVIYTPEDFKKYNEAKLTELKKLANSKEKEKGEKKMNFSLFKKSKIENSLDLENTSVLLPKSKKEKTLVQIINEADEKEVKGNEGLADPSHKVKLHDGSYCNVAELVEKHKAMHDELEAMKEKKDGKDEDEAEVDMKEKPVEVEGDKHNDEEMDNDESDDEGAKKKALELAEHEEKEIEAAKKKNEADKKKKNFEKLKNANLKAPTETARVELSVDKVQRGIAKYGSGK